MIPNKKKSPEELAALREELGIQKNPAETPPSPTTTPPELEAEASAPSTPEPEPSETTKPKKKIKLHSLRKQELPLAPAPEVITKTEIPEQRRSSQDVAEIRRREALGNFSNPSQDPAAHLKKITAHPLLLSPSYLIAIAAAVAAWQRAFFITPLCLIFVSSLLTLYIFLKKKRSRHHAAILTIILVMTLVFGGLYYAPFFSYAT